MWPVCHHRVTRGAEEPDALVAHVRICGGLGRAIALVYPTPVWGQCH